MQSIGTGATESIIVVMDVSSALSVGQSGSRCPGVSLALGDVGHVVCAIVNCHRETSAGSASVFIGDGHRIGCGS